MARRDVIRTVTPSTTAAAIASFTTGRMPGEHGLVGYRVLDAAHDRLVNQLNGWDAGMVPETWQRAATVFETARHSGIRSFAVGAARYADSGFTHAVLRGADHVAAGHPRGQEARVTGPGLDVRCAEAVDQHDHGTGCRRQPEVVLLATETGDRTPEHPGKPRSGDGGHR